MDINIATGPAGATTVTIRDAAKAATFHSDGLGRNKVTFTEDGMTMRSEEWFESTQAATLRLKADLRCQRFIGISFSAAEELFSDAEMVL